MNKYLKILSLSLALSSSVYLPNVNAARSTGMLITIAENNPMLLERLNVIALNDAVLLKHILAMSDSNPANLERLLNLVETDTEVFEQLVSIHNIEEVNKEDKLIAYGTIKDGGLKR